jgi:hypothetical protein
MPNSPYHDKPIEEWSNITEKLIAKHPISTNEIVEIVLRSWNDIFTSKIGAFSIGKEIIPSPQIMSFLLHELVAHYLSLKHPDTYVVGTAKFEKDIHCIADDSLSIEIKGSSHPNQIFANRSYAQPQSENGPKKSKDGYYIAINFEKIDNEQSSLPKILLIRFGYLEHSDLIPQNSATGQQARLSSDAYRYKLKQIHPQLKECEM